MLAVINPEKTLKYPTPYSLCIMIPRGMDQSLLQRAEMQLTDLNFIMGLNLRTILRTYKMPQINKRWLPSWCSFKPPVQT